MNAIEWYNKVALKNGGYRSDARYTVRGISGEDIFREQLLMLLPSCEEVLDAGCGHGDFTLEMAKYTKHICGFDFAEEMINAANQLKKESGIKNVDFYYATTKEPFPFKQEQFDLIYDRRGPISIVDHPHILKGGGLIIGIHSVVDIGQLERRLLDNGLSEFSISLYKDAYLCFPSENDFAQYLSASHMNPDYTLAENQDEFAEIVKTHTVDGELRLEQPRYIWSARKTI